MRDLHALQPTSLTQTISRGDNQVIEPGRKVNDLRTGLRAATAHAHDQLDRTMRSASGWQSRDEYIRFLSVQYQARLPIERWISHQVSHLPYPPLQCHLIKRDINALGAKAPLARHELTISRTSQSAILGVFWVLAGSSLGNRLICKEIKRAGHHHWPTAFLQDAAMFAFWNTLRPLLEQPASLSEIQSAAHAANAVFAHFIHHARTEGISDPTPMIEAL